MKRACTGLVLTLLAALPAAAQIGAPMLTPETPVLEDLVVRAYGGPAWWKVSDNDTTIYILAEPGMPVAPGWDQTILKRRLTGANQLILAPTLKIGLSGVLMLPAISGLMEDLNHNKKNELEAGLPAAVRTRFVATRERFKLPQARYGGLEPGLAGMALAGDVWAAAPQGKPAPGSNVIETVSQAAKQARTPVRPANVYGAVMFRRALKDLRRPGLPCLIDSLDAIDAMPLEQKRRAERNPALVAAWADGDVRPLLDAAREARGGGVMSVNFTGKTSSVHLRISPRSCFAAMPSISDVQTLWVDDEVAAVTKALNKPGHAVAVLGAGEMLMKDGVLDRLRRQGFTVKAPDDAN